MKPFAILLGAAALGLIAQPAFAGSRTYGLAGFDSIRASNHVRVVLKQGPYSVTVEEPNNRFDELDIGVSGSTLAVARKDWNSTWWWGHEGPRFTITISAPAYASVDVSNHADLRANISADSLRLSVSNHADLDGQFTARNLTVLASNHADIHYSGRCESLTLKASNHADVDGQGLDCATVNAESYNHADVSLRASRTVACIASSHGDVTVYGQAVSTSMRSSMHGSIRRI